MDEVSLARQILYRQLMEVPHREYGPMVTALRAAMVDDPDFTAHACVHICTGGSKIRDQQDAAIVSLLQAPSTFAEYREAGRCLLLGSDVYNIEPGGIYGPPPFRIFSIERFIRGPQSQAKVPRLMKSIMTDYVRMLEGDPQRFDGVAIHNRKALKSVYLNYHIKADPRATAILFENKPPQDSKLEALKRIAHSDSLREQVRLVVEHNIPYRIASSILPSTPAVAVALVEVMSPAEALNSRGWVERSGILEFTQVREVFEARVAQATASIASADFRASAQGTDAGVQAAVNAAKERAVQSSRKITRSTLILVDKSSSMEPAIETAIQIGGRIAPICEGELMVVAHDEYAREIRVEEPSLAGWRRAFKGVRARGWTSMVAGLNVAIQDGFVPEQILMITDGGENRPAVGAFAAKMRSISWDPDPHIIIMRMRIQELERRYGYQDALTPTVERQGFRVDKFEIDGVNPDYYIFDQIVELLGGPSVGSLIERIMAVELPHRV